MNARRASRRDIAGAAEGRRAAELEAALRCHRTGDLDGAAKGYRHLLNENPRHADALHLLGLVNHAHGRDADALGLVERAIAVVPHPRYLANQAMLLHRLGRHPEAEQAANAALERQPAYPEVLNTLGAVRLALQRPHAAAEALQRAVVLRPDYAEAHANLGLALAELGQIEAAALAMRTAREINPAILPAAPAARPAGPQRRRKVLYVSVAPHLPGSAYRCQRMAEAARAAGWDAEWIGLSDLSEARVAGLDVMILWRVEWTGAVGRLIALARAGGTVVGLDLDDLITDPTMARASVIDGIRTTGVAEDAVQAHFARIRQMLEAVDFATCTTEELARALQPMGRPVWTLPNRFDVAFWHVARTARRARRAAGQDGLLRIGYAGGTRTHQADMRVVAPALARVLAANPAVRLVLFRDPADGRGVVLLDELPALAPVGDRIEWRNLVPLARLPEELARFDINIAPLQVGNVFVEAKSELKFFEAALVGVPTVASPTGPFRRAIRHGETGLLAADEAGWVEGLTRLLGDADLRARLGRAACRAAFKRYGPSASREAVAAMLAGATRAPEVAPSAAAAPDQAEHRRAARIAAAYRRMAATPMGSDASFWFHGFAEQKRDIHEALMADDTAWLTVALQDPRRTDLMFGFENLARSLLSSAPDPGAAGREVGADLGRLAAALGVGRMDHPGIPTPEPTVQQIEDLLAALERRLGVALAFPAPFEGEQGLVTSRGLISYRAVQALYQAWRAASVVRDIAAPRVLEIGAGLGRTALFAHRLGITDYTIIDIPMSAVASANFLMRVLGDDVVRLYGEPDAPGPALRIVPPSAFLEGTGRYDLAINVDSLPEMPEPTMRDYLAAIDARATRFLSINHEAGPHTVPALHPAPARRRLRMPYWMRAGYVEELYGAA